MFVLVPSTTPSATLHIIAKNYRHIVINVQRASRKVRLLWGILLELEFSSKISEKSQKTRLIKIRKVGAYLFHEERRTDKHGEDNSGYAIMLTHVQKRHT